MTQEPCSRHTVSDLCVTLRSEQSRLWKDRRIDADNLREQAELLAVSASQITAAAPNESSLRHELENRLEAAVAAVGGPWTPFRLELTLRGSDGSAVKGFADVAHGAVVIEYEPPRSFGGRVGRPLLHAQKQAEEYALWLSQEEGRPVGAYQLVAWDGAHIAFGRYKSGALEWGNLAVFDAVTAEQLLLRLVSDGTPLVHPRLLGEIAGPESELGRSLIPVFFEAIVAATENPDPTKTNLLFKEWRRLFGQAADAQSDRLLALLEAQSVAHGQPYIVHPACYLFALNTYVAIVAKIVAALALKDVSEDIGDSGVPALTRLWALETGRPFESAGIKNMLSGDFFSWYVDNGSMDRFEVPLNRLISTLSGVSYDVAQKDPASTRDLFKGMYESFVPEPLRHALGEYYTPDWLASHALDVVGWNTADTLLDPTCGSGTFLLEALRRRLCSPGSEHESADDLLQGLNGFDLNPLAVLAARASLTVFLADRLDPSHPIRLPVYLADAINPAVRVGEFYEHSIQTEEGAFTFRLPSSLVESHSFFDVFERLRGLIDGDLPATMVIKLLNNEFPMKDWGPESCLAYQATIESLVVLHERRWNGIWCSIVAERFAAGALDPVSFIVGNPPWVKWSHLPQEYAEFVKPNCLSMGVFSEDRWVGGIESDISTVVAYSAVEHWAAANADIALYITGTVFKNESSQGFRRFHLERTNVEMRVVRVEDFERIAPFDGVSNHATLLHMRKGSATTYPVPYVNWDTPVGPHGERQRTFPTSDAFTSIATQENLWAAPVPGTDAGPWLVGDLEDHEVWGHVFGPEHAHYRARKGVTTDLNGVFFVTVHPSTDGTGTVLVTNDPSLGRKRLPQIRRPVSVEAECVYPLLRGRGVSPFCATPDPDHCLLLPQTTMHGDPALPAAHPLTHRYLQRFKALLEVRGSYKRYQKGKPYWSLWNVGTYTFSPYKVVWREMAGGSFAAAYVGPAGANRRPVIPDHKVYFVPVETEEEAAYLTGILNAPTVAHAISSYAAQLSLGASVVEYLEIPPYDALDALHQSIAQIAMALTKQQVTPEGLVRLNVNVAKLLQIPVDSAGRIV